MKNNMAIIKIEISVSRLLREPISTAEVCAFMCFMLVNCFFWKHLSGSFNSILFFFLKGDRKEAAFWLYEADFLLLFQRDDNILC